MRISFMKRKRFRFVLGLTFILLFAVICFKFKIFNPQKTHHRKGSNEYLQNSEKFERTDNSIWGIDLSHHQRAIDWEEATQELPYFIFIKATEGKTFTDEEYDDFRATASEAGIKTGAYHFFSYTSDGKEQAEHYCSVADLKKGDLPPVLDLEFKNKMPARSEVTTEIEKWLDYVEEEYGVLPIIYCECAFFDKYIKDYIDKDYPLWISDMGSEPDCDWLFWQSSDHFEIDGIAGKYDHNFFRGTKEELDSILLK